MTIIVMTVLRHSDINIDPKSSKYDNMEVSINIKGNMMGKSMGNHWDIMIMRYHRYIIKYKWEYDAIMEVSSMGISPVIIHF